MKDNTINTNGKLTRKELVKLVVAEIKHIKKNAFKSEINRLDSSEFNYRNRHLCIYGQMTGDCSSPRAKKIMPKTFARIFKSGFDSSFDQEPQMYKQETRKGESFTALEKYLYMCDDKTHKHIIGFLKGEVKKLNIK